MPIEFLLTIHEAAKLLGISEKVLKREGITGGYWRGERRYFGKEEVRQLASNWDNGYCDPPIEWITKH